MIAGLLALLVAAAFSGAALYVSVAEHPARLTLDDGSMLTQWQPAYRRGFAMQGSLAVLGFILGTLAWWQSGWIAFLLGAFVLLAAWPYTLLFMMSTNKVLEAMSPSDPAGETRVLMERWGRLHSVRAALGLGATAIFLWALTAYLVSLP